MECNIQYWVPQCNVAVECSLGGRREGEPGCEYWKVWEPTSLGSEALQSARQVGHNSKSFNFHVMKLRSGTKLMFRVWGGSSKSRSKGHWLSLLLTTSFWQFYTSLSLYHLRLAGLQIIERKVSFNYDENWTFQYCGENHPDCLFSIGSVLLLTSLCSLKL